MKKVLVLFGGVSSEHDVSLNSACSVIKNIPAEKYEVIPMGITKDGRCYIYNGSPDMLPGGKWLEDAENLEPAVISSDRAHHGIIRLGNGAEIERIDVVFPVLHGKNGEDGTMQGLLEIAGIPYVGCGTAASSACMDKAVTNALADFYGIPQAKWVAFDRHAYSGNKAALLANAAEKLGFPIFVKPANAGSSVGISKAKTLEELEAACEKAFEHDKKLVLEEGVVGMEVEVAVLGNEEPAASVVGEVVPCNEFYDYDAKYLANESELHIPARLPEEKLKAVQAQAIRAYRALGCEGFTRVDFFVRTSDGEIMLNEPNTIPGFTSISMYPKLWAASGVPYSELLDKLIELAMEK
ncbi:MAG: D-alanine--D-alanine ligase [Clostridia bacterium]|nr:D-alanine--D-alanine ligase [Clostridia bacterium]